MGGKVLNFALSVLIFALAFVMILSGFVMFKVADIDELTEKVITDEYTDAMYSDVKKAIMNDCDVLIISSDTVLEHVEKEELVRISKEVFKGDMNRLIYGKETEYAEFKNPALKKAIRAELREFARNNNLYGEDLDESMNENYDFIIGDINNAIHYLKPESFSKLSLSGKLPGWNFYVGGGFVLLAIVYVSASLFKIYYNGRKKAAKSVYNILLLSWLASAICFFPALIVKVQDLNSKLAITYSGLRFYLQNIIKALIDPFFTMTLVLFCILTLALIISVVFAIRSVYRRRKEEESENRDADEIVFF